MTSAVRTVYLVMPIVADPWYMQKVRVLIREAAKRDVNVILPADGRHAGQKPAEVIWTEVTNAAEVIADLSFERPSCYFEVGLAQGLGKNVSLIAQNGSSIHQVFGHESVKYFRDLDEYADLISMLLSGK